MKITINVECTPEEARRYMGLPDVAPLNDMLIEEMTKRAQQNIQLMTPGAMMGAWMNVGAQAQDAFTKLMTSAASARKGHGDKS